MRRRTALGFGLVALLILGVTGSAVVAIATTPGDSAGTRQDVAPIVGSAAPVAASPTVSPGTSSPAPVASASSGPVVVQPVEPHDLNDDHGGGSNSGKGSSGGSGKGD